MRGSIWLVLALIASACTTNEAPSDGGARDDGDVSRADAARDDGGANDAAGSDGAISPPDGALPDGALPDAALPDAGPRPETYLRAGPACTDSGWCWETPLPGGGEVHGIATPERGHVVVSTQQRFFHRDPSGWIGSALSPRFTRVLGLVRVWGAAIDDVWAVGPEGGSHFDGVEWTERSDLFYALAVHGFAADDVWATGGGAYQHFDGTSWTATTGGTFSFNDVWSIGPGEAIIVGNAGIAGAFARHVEAGGSSDLPAPPAGPRFFRAVYASTATDVWAGSEIGLHHFVSGAWTQVASGVVVELWGSSANDVWAATASTNVLHWNGTTLETIALAGASPLASITGTGEDDVWVGDNAGAVHHWDGTTWTMDRGPLVPSQVFSVAIRDDGEGWAVTGDALLERAADREWTRATPPTTMHLDGVAAAGAETFLFSDAGAYRRSGSTWASTAGGAGLADACTTSDGTTLGVGDSVFARYESGAWSTVPAPRVRFAQRVHCVGDEAFAVGNGTVVHWNGETWGRLGLVSVGSMPITRAHSSAADDAWVVAGDGAMGTALMHFDGTEWREVVIGSTNDVLSVGGSSATNVWVAGEAGLVRRYDGAAWTTLDAPTTVDFEWIDADADGTARALTRRGAVWTYDGTSWAEASPGFGSGTPFSSGFVDDAAFVDDEIFATGDSDEPLRWAAGTWEELPSVYSYDRVAASDAAGAWFFGSSSGIGHWSGTAMDRPAVGRSGTLDIAVVGADAYLVTRYDALRIAGTSLVDEVHVSGVIGAFFGSSADAGWVISPPEISDDRFEVQRDDGGTWVSFPELASPVGFASEAGGDVLAVTAETGIFRRSAGVVTTISPPRAGIGLVATAAHPYADDDAWALDQSTGGMVHWDGTSWTALADGVGFGFRTYEVTPEGELFAGGDRASIARHTP